MSWNKIVLQICAASDGRVDIGIVSAARNEAQLDLFNFISFLFDRVNEKLAQISSAIPERESVFVYYFVYLLLFLSLLHGKTRSLKSERETVS